MSEQSGCLHVLVGSIVDPGELKLSTALKALDGSIGADCTCAAFSEVDASTAALLVDKAVAKDAALLDVEIGAAVASRTISCELHGRSRSDLHVEPVVVARRVVLVNGGACRETRKAQETCESDLEELHGASGRCCKVCSARLGVEVSCCR
jgi:hypothetical protein